MKTSFPDNVFIARLTSLEQLKTQVDYIIKIFINGSQNKVDFEFVQIALKFTELDIDLYLHSNHFKSYSNQNILQGEFETLIGHLKTIKWAQTLQHDTKVNEIDLPEWKSDRF